MLIKMNTRVKVNHDRKGEFIAIADRDFDTKKEEFYPFTLVSEEPVKSLKGNPKWIKGDSIPCRNSLCTFEILN